MGFKIAVTAASGVEGVTKKEIEKLGYGSPSCENGTFTFDGDELAVARLNLFLRTADRVYIELGSFTAETFDDLFDGVRALPFERFIPKDGRVLVDGKCVKSTLFAVTASQRIVKKAIVTRLQKAYHVNTVPETGETFEIEFVIFKNVVSIRLNTSGAGLHKRGYRDYVGRAPIKETLASAMLLLSDFYFDKPFVDPFCGSGTFVIEGARIALNIAAGISRDFAYREWSAFRKDAYTLALEEAKDKERRNFSLDFTGFDLDKKAIDLSLRHAKQAGVADKVRFYVGDVKDFSSSERFGTIVTNPPYGERLLTEQEVLKLYKTLGNVYRKLNDWSLYAITSAEGFEKAFGQRADKNRKLYNSNKECRFYGFVRKNRYYRNKGEEND